MNKQLLLLFFFGFLNIISAQTENIEAKLSAFPDLVFKKIETAENFKATYELKIKQPLDHSDSSKGFFHQKVFLSHKGFDRPTVMITEGYSRSKNKIYELTKFINANQIDIEHRFFGSSMPDTLNYGYLNLKQATADLHHIKELIGNLYLKKWISTGISKGGATTIF